MAYSIRRQSDRDHGPHRRRGRSDSSWSARGGSGQLQGDADGFTDLLRKSQRDWSVPVSISFIAPEPVGGGGALLGKINESLLCWSLRSQADATALERASTNKSFPQMQAKSASLQPVLSMPFSVAVCCGEGAVSA